jgi:hypothetical protein
MPAKAICPHCQLSLKVPSDYAGKSVKCPQCQQRFIVSTSDAPAGSPAPLAAPAPPAKPDAVLRGPAASVEAPSAFDDLVMSVLNEGEEDTEGADGHVEKVAGPSHFWSCPKCKAVWEKKPLQVESLKASRIKAMVRCETCGAAYDYAAVHSGKYDTLEIKITCPKCHLELTGPAEDLLDKHCPGCGGHLPKK